MEKTFNNLLLLGRPASGKSEFIDFLKQVPEAERARRYGIGRFEEMDDFPWIWEKFMEDDIWEKAGYPRRFSFGGDNPGMAREGAPLFDFCIRKFNAEYARRFENNPAFFGEGTLFLEFARGGEGAYAKALENLSDAVLKEAAILFIYVSHEESLRRNEARYRDKLKHSVLAHKVPDETMDAFYRTHDWLELTGKAPSGLVKVRGFSLPFVTMNNEPELTDVAGLDARYHAALAQLMEHWRQSRGNL